MTAPVAIVALVAAVFLAVAAGVAIGWAMAASRRERHPSGSPESTSPNHSASSAEAVEAAMVPGPLAEAVDRIDQGVVILDGQGEEIYRNAAATRLGTARDSRSLVESTLRSLLVEARTRRQSRSDEVELFGPPAQLFAVSAHPFPLGEEVGAMGVVEDRSDARRTETVRRDFVANISHELKTPVGALGLLAETILDECDPAVLRRLAERMVTEADRAARTIDDLLELSRIEFGDDTDFALIGLADIVGEAVSRIGNAAEQAGVQVVVDVAGDAVVNGDRRQLVSALFNLLDNAVKYSAGGGEVRVTASSDDVAGVVALSVIDEGIGIPKRSLDRIFERFYRVDRARSRNTGGTGLGLAIVRHVVSNHGGSVIAESAEGQGSTFTLVLPRVAAKVEP